MSTKRPTRVPTAYVSSRFRDRRPRRVIGRGWRHRRVRASVTDLTAFRRSTESLAPREVLQGKEAPSWRELSGARVHACFDGDYGQTGVTRTRSSCIWCSASLPLAPRRRDHSSVHLRGCIREPTDVASRARLRFCPRGRVAQVAEHPALYGKDGDRNRPRASVWKVGMTLQQARVTSTSARSHDRRSSCPRIPGSDE